MASIISLGFRRTKYTHPTQDEGHSNKVEEPKGWAPIRQVIAVAEERHRRQPLTVPILVGAISHAVASRRAEQSLADLEATVKRFKPSGIKRALKQRQTLPAFQG